MDNLFNKKITDIQKLQEEIGSNISTNAQIQFFNALKKLNDWECIRINPIDFAEKNNLDLDEAVKLFIFGAKAGLFNFEWSLLCPLCGGREHSYETLNQLEKEVYHCTLCDIDVKVNADKHLEVSFTIPDVVRGSSIDPYTSLDNYWSFFFSPFIVWPPELVKAFEEQPKLQYAAILPSDKTCFKLKLTSTKRYRIVTFDTHSILTVDILGQRSNGVQKIRIEHDNSGFIFKKGIIEGIAGELEIINTSDKIIGCICSSPDSNYLQQVIAKAPPYFKPFITGKMMFNNQIFRNLFLIDNLPDDLSLKINDITLLFTDLKGSTELYAKTGDVYAYKLVQNHFSILQKIVHKYRGGVVKTMGDAIMASFNNPIDGIKAGFSMLEEIELFNKNLSSYENAIGLKVGLHRGKVIAVKANQTLDYFGQTVNIAARVQGLAGSQEIWITDNILSDKNIHKYIKTAGYNLLPKKVLLKGVEDLVKVYLCHR